MTIPLIAPFVANDGQAPNVTPFTFRDGRGYLQRFEALVKYLNNYIVPWVEEHYVELAEEFAAKVAEIEGISTDLSQYVTDAETAKNDAVTAKNQAQTYAAQAGTAQDTAITGHINNVASATRAKLNELYAGINIANIVNSGRLSQAALDTYYTAFFSDEFAGIATDVAGVNNAVVTTNNRITTLENGRIATAESNILNNAANLSYKMNAVDLRIQNPSEWGAPVGQALSIPTHVVPDSRQPAHPSILFFPERWNGYRYWMAYTPYPGDNDDHEDPNIAVSNDGINWIHAPGVTQPLDDASGIPYNSDPDLVMAGNTMFLFWRYYDSTLPSNQEKLYMRKSTDGITWTPKQLVWQYNETVLRPLSPSFIFEDNRWTCYFVDVTGGSRVFKRMVSTNADPTAGWGAPTTLTITPGISGKEVWHVSVRRVGGGLIGIMTVINPGAGGIGGLLQLISSNDGVTWKGSAETVVPQVYTGQHNNLYRASFVVGYNDGVLGLWLYYSAYQDTPAPNTWNIFRTFLGPFGKGEPVSVTAGPNITLSNVDVRRRGNWIYGSVDWTRTTALSHGDVILTFPTWCFPVVNDIAMTTGPLGTAAYPSVINASTREIVGNNPPASKTTGGLRFKFPIIPA